jgi:glycolate oxidase
VTGYDVTSLLVGSEGTLAIITRAVLQLVPKPRGIATLLAPFSSIADATRGVGAILRSGEVPRCVELFDEASLELVRARGVAVPPGQAMLLVEVDGDEVGVEKVTERVGAALDEISGGVLAATDAAQRDRLWEARRAMSPATRASARFKVSEDVVVPRRHMGALIDESRRIAERARIRTLTYGHAGDGNLHVNFLWDDPERADAVGIALGELFAETVRLGGTLTGEHGVGISKRAYLALEQSEELIELQRGLKRAFDPDGLLNPGKIFHARGHGAC